MGKEMNREKEKNIVFLNGMFVPALKAKISVFDRGVLYGDGLFETMRAYNGKVFAIREHLERMYEGAKVLGMPFIPSPFHQTSYIKGIIRRLLKFNNLENKDSYIRLTLTRGIDFKGILPSDNIHPTTMVFAKPISRDIEKKQKIGIKAITIDFSKTYSHISAVKSLNFLDNIVGSLIAKNHGVDEALFTNAKGQVLEGTISNIFIAKKSIIKTPPLKSRILPGITRYFVIILAKKIGLKVVESPITIEDVIKSDEAFLTNSIIEITPLINIDREIIGKGKPGKITKKLQTAYKDLVRLSAA